MKKTYVRNNLLSIGILIGILLVSVLGIYYLKGIYPFGSTTIAWGDMGQETLPIYYYLYDVLTGKSAPFFSWQVAAGTNVSGCVAEWSLLSPLNLFLLLTKKENIYNFISILLLFKMICMALSMYVFSGHYKIDYFYRVLVSILYAASSCLLIHYQIGFMIDIAVIFPLLILGLYRLLDDNSLLLYIGMLALILVVNVYIGVMALIYVFLASGLYIRLNVNGANHSEKVWRLAGATVLAVMIGGVVWFPAVISLMGSARLEKNGIMGWIGTYILACKYHWSEEDWHFTHFFLMNACFLLAVILLRVAKKIRCSVKERYHRWLSALMLLPLIIPGVEILWHTGSRVCWPVRFAFMITFTLIEYVCYILEADASDSEGREPDVRKGKKKAVAAGILALAGISWCAILFAADPDYSQTEILVLVSGCVFVTAQIYVLYQYRALWKKGLISILVLAEVLGNMKIWLAPSFFIDQDSIVYLEQSSRAGEEIALPDNALVRTKDYYGILDCNYAFPMNSRSIANFIHIIPSEQQDALSSMGYSINYTKLLDIGGTVFTDALLGMDYVFSDVEMEDALYKRENQESDEDILWYESRYTLPSGIYMDKDPENVGDLFDYQNEIFKVMTNSAQDLIQEEDVDEEGYARLTLDGERVLYFYGYTSGTVQVQVNGAPVVISNGRGTARDNPEYPVNNNNGMVCLGVFEDEEVEIQFSAEEKSDYAGIELGILDLQTLSDSFEEIHANSNVQLVTGKDSVEVDCTAQKPTYLFLPISYDTGWDAAVNGEKVEIQSFLGNFIAVPLEAGENHVSMSYAPPGTALGWGLTLAGLVILAVWIIMEKMGKARKMPVIEKGIYYVHAGCFRIFMIGFFLLPMIGYALVLIVLTLNRFFPSTQNFIDHVAKILDHFRSRY